MDQQLNRLPTELVSELSRCGEVQRFDRGEILIQEGERANTLLVLLSGKLKVYSLDQRDREVIYNQLGPGEILGEMLLDGGTRSASVKALVPSECLVVDAEQARALLRAHPDFAECLVVKLISRLRTATRTIRSLALHDVHERVVALLEEVAVPDGDVRRVPRHYTQGQIAAHIGATREMVNHIVRDLRVGGYLRKDAEHQLILLKKLPKR